MRQRKTIFSFGFSEEKHWIQAMNAVDVKGKVIGIGQITQTPQRYKRDVINFNRARKTSGMCLLCGEIDWLVLEEHHVDPVKLPKFKISLCANCHKKIHWFTGGNTRIRRQK